MRSAKGIECNQLRSILEMVSSTLHAPQGFNAKQ